MNNLYLSHRFKIISILNHYLEAISHYLILSLRPSLIIKLTVSTAPHVPITYKEFMRNYFQVLSCFNLNANLEAYCPSLIIKSNPSSRPHVSRQEAPINPY